MKVEPIKIKIWTRAYSPFILGGDVNAPIGCEVEGVKITLGKGFHGVAVFTPSGDTVIAEFTTGAIVGRTAEEVRNDIAAGDTQVMQNQVNEAMAMLPSVRWVSPEEFWKRYERT